MESVRVVQANFLVYYHNMRFFDGKRNWLRVNPVPPLDDIATVRHYMGAVHSVQRGILQVGLNMFFVLSGASNILSMKEKQNLWRVVGERFFKLIVAFFFGFLIMGLPVSLIMLLYKEGTIINASADAWKEVLFTSPGQLYFLPYMFGLWVLHLPLFCVMKACYDTNSRSLSSSTNPTSTSTTPTFDTSQRQSRHRSAWSLALFVCGTVVAPLLWMWCWLGLAYGTLAGLVLGASAFLLSHLARAKPSGAGALLSLPALTHHAQLTLGRFMEYYFDLQYEWMIPMSTLAPSLMLTWANQYFSSLLINTGIVLVYVLPLLTAAFPMPTAITLHFSSLTSCHVTSTYGAASSSSSSSAARFDSDDVIDGRKAQSRAASRLTLSINLPLVSLFSIVAGHVLIISALDILGPDEIPSPTSFFGGLVSLSPDTSRSLGTSFFTSVSHSAFYVFGFAWMLFEDRLPCFWTACSNLSLAFYFFMNICLLKWSFPDQEGFVFVGPGYITYKPRLQRFFYVVGSWYWMWIYSQLCKYHGNYPFQSKLQQFIRDSTFGLFIIHPVFEYLMACSMNAGWWGMNVYTWGQKALILNVVTFGMSYLTVYLLLKIPAVAPFLGVKPPRRPSSSTLPRRNESYHSLSSPTS